MTFRHCLFVGLCCSTLLSPVFAQQELEDLLEMDLEQLLDISVVTAGKTSANISDSPAIISVITREEIKNLGARTMTDLLNLIPGFEMNRAVMFGVHESVGVRGRMTDFGEDVLILLDGQRLNEVYTGGGTHQIKFVNLANVERIELIRGPGSTLYGSNAFVGIVNIITADGTHAASEPTAFAGGNSFDGGGAGLSFGREGRDYHWSVHAEYHTDGGDTYQPQRGYLRPPIPLPAVEDPIARNFDLGFRLEAGDLDVKIDHFTRELDGFMPWGLLDHAWDSEILDTNRDDTRLTRAMISYQAKLGEWQLTPSVRHFEGKIRQLYFLAAPGVPPFSAGTSVADVGWVGSPSHDTRSTEYELQLNRTLGKHDLVAGLFYGDEALTGAWNLFNFYPFPTDLPRIDYGTEVHWFDGAESYVDPQSRSVSAVYIQDTWKPTDRLGVTAGIRYDDYSDFGNSTNPRFGLIYKPNEKFHLKALYGQAFRAPTYNELYIRNNPVQRGNESLNAQTIQTLELFGSYTFNQKLVGSFSLYRNTYQDLINLVDMQPFPTYFNATEDEEDQGIELELKYKQGRYRYVFLNYSFIDPTDGAGQTRAYIARNKLSIVANFDIDRRFIFNVSGFYRGSRENPTGDTGYEIDNHWVWNANIRILKLMPKLEGNISFHDLGDEQWRSPGFSYVLTPDNVPNRGFQIAAGISYNF